jgi:hypothetical protein
MFDDLGHARGFGAIQAAALRYDRAGGLAAKAGFVCDIYRLGVHPLGRGTSSEIQRALTLMNLSLPLRPDSGQGLRRAPSYARSSPGKRG